MFHNLLICSCIFSCDTPRTLEIIVTVVVDRLDKFGGLSVLQTLGSFLVHLQFIVVVRVVFVTWIMGIANPGSIL